MAATVTIGFRIGDVDSVARATRTVIQGAQQAAREQARAVAQAAREAANAQKAAAKEAAAFQRELDKAGAAAFKARLKEQDQAAKRSAKEQADAQKAAAKDAAAFQRELDKASRRNAFDRIKEIQRAQAEAEKAAQAATNRRRAAVGEVGGGAVAGFKRGVGALAGVAALATGGLGMGTVVDAVRSQMALGERSALLQNASGKNVDFVKMSKGVSSEVGISADEVMGGLEKLSGKAGGAGIDAVANNFTELAKVARGAGVSITDLGDVLGTLVNRNVESKDLVTTVESLVKQGKDGAVEFKDLATMLDASSGALGRFKMGENQRVLMAGGLSQLARTYGKSSAAEATNAVVDLARDLGGKADIVQQLTGGQKTTVTTKGKQVKKLVNGKMVTTTEGGGTKTTYAGGVEVGTDETRAQLRDVGDLLPQIIMGAIKHGNAGRIMGEGGIFTGNSTAIVGPLIQAATQGIVKNAQGRYELSSGDKKAEVTGEQAIRAMLAQSAAADVKPGESKAAFDKVMGTDAAKFSQVMEKLKNDLGDKLAPAITRLTPQVVKLASAFGDGVALIAEHPKKAAAAFVGLTTVAGALEGAFNVATKALGEKLLDKIVGKTVPVMNVQAGSVNVAGGPGVGGGLGALANPPVGAATTAQKAGAVGLGAVIGVGMGVATGEAIDQDLKSREGRALAAQNLAAKIRAGQATAEDMATAKSLTGQLEEDKGAGAFSRFITNATAGYRGVANGDVSAGNVASLFPGVAAARGVVGSVLEGQQQDVDKNTGASLDELKNAIANPRPVQLAPGQGVRIENAAEIAAAVSKGGGRDPASQPIVGK